MKYDLDSVNDSFKTKGRAKTAPAIAPRQTIEELRIAHVTNANRQKVNFDSLREKIGATLDAAQVTSSAATQLSNQMAKVSPVNVLAVDHMKRKLDGLVATLTTLQRKLA